MLDTQTGELWTIAVNSNDVARLYPVQYAVLKDLSVSSPDQIDGSIQKHFREQALAETSAHQKKYDPEFIVNTLARIDQKLASEDYRAEAETYLQDNITEIELLGISAKAKSGAYGTNSSAMLSVAEKWIPIIKTKEETK